MEKNKINIEKISKLARLSFSTEEKEKIKDDLQEIISFANCIKEFDEKDISLNDLSIINAFRKDEAFPSPKRDAMLKNAPHTENGCILVSRVTE